MLTGLILVLIGLLINCIVADCDLRVLAGTILVSVGIIIFILENHPTAMDVYKGKTTLEITYKDSIPIDSVVVFKNKEK